jgi:hypothetical protein
MSDSKDARQKLDRLVDALIKDIDALSDEELIEEVAADGDVEKAVNQVEDLIESAIAESGRRRLTRARRAYDAVTAKDRPKVILLPLSRKKALVAHFADSSKFPEKLTLAARNADNTEADIDGLLEDLLELGVIDDKGNVR